MNKLALMILASTALAPTAAMAQTVTPADPYEGTPQVSLKKPGTAAAAAAPARSAPIAQPTPPAPPTPPAGITWRNQAAPAPSMAPMGRSATPPPPIETQRAATPPPPIIAPSARVEAVPPPRIIVTRREPGLVGAGPADFQVRRELEERMSEAPARVIVRRERHGGTVDPDLVEDYDRMEESFGPDYDDYAGHQDDRDDYAGEPIEHDYEGPVGQPLYGHGYAGGCCSGGMITETITTTTTYPPTVEERVVHHEVRSHPPRRTYKRKLRGR